MGIYSIRFVPFAITVILLYNLARPRAWRQTVLLIANIYFLASFASNFKAFVPFISFLALGFMVVRLMQNRRGQSAYLPMLVGVIVIFVWLKKYTFLPTTTFLRFPYVTIGLSYIFFRILHLIIDTRDGSLPDRIGPIAYLNYTLNFTSLVAGPIQWYPEFAATQLDPVRPPLTLPIAGRAIERIITGFFKAIVPSMLFSSLQSWALSLLSPVQPFVARVLTGAVIAAAYPIYLYFNFSGYTDIVIGVARFMRLTLPENFNRPFSSLNFIDFWNRWHITLSRWLKTYVYTPLVKSLMQRYPSPSVEPYLGVIGFFVTFFLVGVWHGQTSVFLVFGVWLGLGVSVNKLYQVLITRRLGRKGYKALANDPIYQAFARGLTFTWFTFSMFWFWSTWGQMTLIAVTMRAAAIATMWPMILLGATVALAAWEVARNWALSLQWNGGTLLLSPYFRTVWLAALMITTLLVLAITNAEPEPVYRNF